MALAIHIPQVRPEVGSGRSGYLSSRTAAAAEGREGRGLEQLGKQITGIAADRIERQAKFQVATAMADYEMQSNKWTDEFLSNEQMGERVKGGKDAFAAGDKEYADFLASTSKQISKGLLPQARDAFRLFTTQHDVKSKAKFADTLTARQQAYNQDQAMTKIMDLTRSGSLDMVNTYIAANADLWSPEDMDKVFDMARKETLFQLMATDPEEAGQLAKEVEWSTPGLERQIVGAAQDTARAMKAQAEKAAEQAIVQTGRETYANMLTFSTTGGRQGEMVPVSTLSQQYAAGAMTKTAYDACMAIWEDKAKPGPMERNKAYSNVADALERYEASDISEKEYEEIRLGNSPLLDDAANEHFIKYGAGVYNDVVNRLKTQTTTDAKAIFAHAALYGQEAKPEEQVAMRGDVKRRMDQWVQDVAAPNKPFPTEKYERESLRVIGIVRDEWLESKKTPSKEKAKDGIPEGFKDVWSELTTEQHETIKGMTPRQQKRFLEYRAKHPKPLKPILDVGDLPSSVFR